MVEVVKTPDRYRCQTCGAAYDELWRAELCESIPVAPVRHKVGQVVKIQTRYEGVVKAEIVGTQMTNYQSEAMSRCKSKEHLAEIMAKKEDPLPQHGYSLLVDTELEMGKGDYTNRILLWAVVG